MDNRGQFTFYRSFWDAVKGLPKKDKLPILEAIISYALDGTEPVGLSQSQGAFFLLCRPTLDASRKKAANGKQGGSKPKANGKQTETEKEKEKEKEIEIEIEKENEYECIKAQGAPAAVRKKYGQFGWVRLTQEERQRLTEDLGEAEANRCITHVDEAAQATGNKNKWKDWNLVVRKCSREGWGKSMTYRTGKKEIPKGASGQLGQEELEAIQSLLKEG